MTEHQKRTYPYPARAFYEVWMVVCAFVGGVALDDWWMKPWFQVPKVQDIDGFRLAIAVVTNIMDVVALGLTLVVCAFALGALCEVYHAVDETKP